MTMTQRYYSSVASEKTLTGTITAGQTTLQVSNTIGLPGLFPYTIAVDYETVTEELVEVTSAAGTTLTIVRGVDGTSATSHTSGARVRHVTSARDFADSRNHENSSNGVHGLDPSEDLVGTNKVQTLSNKTFVNATGTFQNIDITNVPAHATTWTNTPAAGAAVVVWRMINGTDQHVEWKGNGLLNIRNNVAMDTSDGTRRFQVTQSNGTTEKFYITASGTAVSLPRASSATTNYAFKAIDPNDAQIRPMFAVRNNADSATRFAAWSDGHTEILGTDPSQIQLNVQGAAAQAASYFRVTDSTPTVITQVDNTGKFSTQKTAEVKNTLNVNNPVLQVYGFAPGQVANLQEWFNGAGTRVAYVDATGAASFAPASATSGIITASPGWSVAYQQAVVVAGMATINVGLSRTGANIVASSTGDLTGDPFYGTLSASYRPDTGFGSQLMPFMFTNDIGDGAAVLTANTGDIQLTSYSPTGTINTGSTVRICMTFPL